MMKSRVRSILEKERISSSLAQRICDIVPMASHNQRGHVTISVELPPDQDVDVRDISAMVHGKLNQVYGVLKREDELELVYRAHKNPTFVEDACRKIAEGIYELLRRKLRPDSKVRILLVSEESIHQHNAFAEIEMSLEQLKYFVDIHR
jgi:GTP cyclohydrolase-4